MNLNTLNNTPFNCPDYKCVQYAGVYLYFKIQIYASKIVACIISTHFIHMTGLKIILWSIRPFDRYKRPIKNKTVVCFYDKKGIIMVKITFFKEKLPKGLFWIILEKCYGEVFFCSFLYHTGASLFVCKINNVLIVRQWKSEERHAIYTKSLSFLNSSQW